MTSGWRGSLARGSTLTARAEARRRWVAAIAAAGAASEDWPAARRADFLHELKDLDPLTFPAEGLSAKRAAMGFRELASAFACSELESRRAVLAPAVAAAAKALDGLRHDDARAMASRTWLKGENA